MSCINRNSKEFIKLETESGMHPIILSAKISSWQTDNNTDAFPTLEELTGSGIPDDITRSNMVNVEKANQKFYERRGKTEIDRYTEYLNNEATREVDTLATTEDKINRMQNALDAEVMIDTSLDVSGRLLGTDNPIAQKYDKPVILINPNLLFDDTVIHEFGHLYIDLLGGLSDSKVQDAIEMLKGTPLWDKVRDNNENLRGDLLAKEVLATALGIEGDLLYKNDLEKRTTWQTIKNFFLNLINKLLFKGTNTNNAISQLASEMLSGEVRLTGEEVFNTLVDQNQKLFVDNPTQSNIDKLFDYLKNRFVIKEDANGDRVYEDAETQNMFAKSVSSLGKSLTKNRYNSRKGSFDLRFSKGFKLTPYTYSNILNSSVLPMALDRAMQDFFTGNIDSDLIDRADSASGQYWYNKYLQLVNDKDAIQDINEVIEGSIGAINDAAEAYQKDADLTLKAGNMVHEAIEAYINARKVGGTIDLPPNINDEQGKLMEHVKKIVDEGMKAGSTFYAEQELFSDSAGLPGTADLIEITKDGKFKIYDFKTYGSFLTSSFAGKRKTPYQMYVSPGYVNQILIYATMLQEYNIQPAEDYLNILAIEVDREAMDVSEDQPTVSVTNAKLANILSLAEKNSDVQNAIIAANNNILGLFKSPSRFTSSTNIEKEEQEIDRLAERIQRALHDYKKLGTDLNPNRELEQFTQRIENELIGKKNKIILLEYIQNMRNALSSVYNESVNKPYLTSTYLRDLQFLTQASSFIGDVRTFLEEGAAADFEISGQDVNQLINLIKETEKINNEVLSFQRARTKEKAIEVLASNSSFMEGVFTENFEVQARQELSNPTQEEINAFIHKKMSEQLTKNEIRKAEYEFWQKIFNEGYTDIRAFEWLIADPGMNKSQFVQVAKNVIDKADMASRIDLDNSVAEIVNWYDNIEGMETTGDPDKVWDKFIERGAYLDKENKQVPYKTNRVIPKYTTKKREIYLKFKDQIDNVERKIVQARRKNQAKLVDKYVEDIKQLREIRIKAMNEVQEDEAYIHPEYEKLSEKEKEALDFIHKKLEESNDRLANNPYAKSVQKVGDVKVFYLPNVRKTGAEAIRDAGGALNRFTSGVRDFWEPPADEDEWNLTDAEQDREMNDLKTNATDIVGDPLYDVPVFYRKQLDDPSLQSFDIPTLLAMNEETTIKYQHFKGIEPDLFMITESLKNTDAKKTDSVVHRKIADKIKGTMKKELKSPDNRVLKAVQSSINNRVYKRTYVGVYSKANYRAIKALEGIGKYTSTLLLGGNFGSAATTATQGTLYRMIEGVAGEDFTMKDVKVGSQKAFADIHNMIADTQKQFPTSLTNLLIRRFGLETQYKALVNKFVQDNFALKNMDESTIFAVTTMAETMVTASLMYTLMNNIKVMNGNGDFINSKGQVVSREDAMTLDEAYSVENGQLVLDKNVIYTDRNLREKFRDNISGEKTVAATEISNFIRSKYADLYGQYNQDMKSVAEMHIIGKLVFSMRKWFPRGMHRRWRGITSFKNTFEEMRDQANFEKRFYSQDQKKFQEGYYTTGVRYVYSVLSALKNASAALSVSSARNAMGEVNNTLTTHERANLRRLLFELAIITVTSSLALLMKNMAFRMDEEDKNTDAVFFSAYLAERIKMESMSFINPAELMAMVENPAAAVNVISRITDLYQNLAGVSFDPDTNEWDWEINNRYERGPREGELKVGKKIQNLLPFYKKGSQILGILGIDSKESIEESYRFMADMR